MAFARTASITVLLGAIAACTSEPQSAPVDQAAEAAKIAQLEIDWSDKFGAGDVDGFASMLAQETVLIVPGFDPVVGIDDIRAATEEMLELDEETSWKSDFAFVAPSGDMAYDYGTATSVYPDGSVAEGLYLVVWVKEGGEWKIAADMFNTPVVVSGPTN